MNEKTQTLFGGVLVTVKFGNHTAAEVLVRQLPLGEYPKAFKLIDDEIELTALICGKPRSWLEGTAPDYADSILPECYEQLQAKAREVNAKGFFPFAARRRVQEQKAQESMFAALANLPAETIQAAAEMGSTARTSPISSPRPQPMPASR